MACPLLWLKEVEVFEGVEPTPGPGPLDPGRPWNQIQRCSLCVCLTAGSPPGPLTRVTVVPLCEPTHSPPYHCLRRTTAHVLSFVTLHYGTRQSYPALQTLHLAKPQLCTYLRITLHVVLFCCGIACLTTLCRHRS